MVYGHFPPKLSREDRSESHVTLSFHNVQDKDLAQASMNILSNRGEKSTLFKFSVGWSRWKAVEIMVAAMSGTH